jgi:hypothetical protein
MPLASSSGAKNEADATTVAEAGIGIAEIVDRAQNRVRIRVQSGAPGRRLPRRRLSLSSRSRLCPQPSLSRRQLLPAMP